MADNKKRQDDNDFIEEIATEDIEDREKVNSSTSTASKKTTSSRNTKKSSSKSASQGKKTSKTTKSTSKTPTPTKDKKVQKNHPPKRISVKVKQKPEPTEDIKEMIIRYKQNGMTNNDIVKHLGISFSTLKRLLTN